MTDEKNTIKIKVTGPHLALWVRNAKDRLDIAHFAAWCMGSCHGDGSPKVEEIFRAVLTDDSVYEHYREQAKEKPPSVSWLD